jgi:hypothetical protein
MKTGDLAVYLPENLLVTIIAADYSDSGGVVRHKVRPANNKKAATRILPADKFREATPDMMNILCMSMLMKTRGKPAVSN